MGILKNYGVHIISVGGKPDICLAADFHWELDQLLLDPPGVTPTPTGRDSSFSASFADTLDTVNGSKVVVQTKEGAKVAAGAIPPTAQSSMAKAPAVISKAVGKPDVTKPQVKVEPRLEKEVHT